MNYEQTVAYIHSFPRLAKTGRFDRIEALLGVLGHPEKKGHYIHVTGTNGKGSTASCAAHILEEAGMHVGLYTSPFIMRFNERFMIDHQPIPDADLVTAAATVKAAIDKLRLSKPDFGVTEFEFITTLAFWYFDQQKVDAAVIEVGIGGLTDSTNVIMPDVSVITSVGMDHMKLLGNTLQSIAHHKAGIIKQNRPAVTAVLPEEAEKEVAKKVAETSSQWLRLGHEFSVQDGRISGWGQIFTYQDEDGQLKDLTVPMLGTYQLSNAACAIRAAKILAKAKRWPLAAKEIRKGVAESTWEGRLEKISDNPLIVLDGAHNPQAVGDLVQTLKQVFGHQPLTLIAGILADKDVKKDVELLSSLKQPLNLVPVPDNPRATKEDAYPTGERITHFDSWQEALANAMHENPEAPIIFCGSLYLVSAVRQTLIGAGGND